MKERALELTDPNTGFITENGGTTLIHDRDGCFVNDDFKDTLKSRGVECLPLPARSPNLNAYAERFVQTVKYECLNKADIIGEEGLRNVLNIFVEHYHHDRPHQGIDNTLIEPDENAIDLDAPIEHHSRLGGVLHEFYRNAA